MKILHTADIHLGTELYGHYDPLTGASSRLQDFAAALDRAVDYAIAERVDLFLFAGDAYKTRDPSPTQQREFALRLRRLLEASVPVFLLTGNHDMPNAVQRATSLDIFGTLPLANLHVARKPDLYQVQTPAGPLQIVAVPWITRSALMARDELKNKTVDEMNKELLARLEQFMAHAVGRLVPGVPVVLTLHGSIAGATFGSERSTMLGTDLLIPRSLVANPAFSYVALGHIHKHQQLAESPPVVYCGGLERIDFGEEHDPKGFVVVEIEGTSARWRFVESGARPFTSLSVRAHGTDPTAEVLAALDGRDLLGAIVKLEVHLLDSNHSAFQEGRVRTALRGAYHLSIVRSVDRADRQRGRGFSTVLSPLQNLSAYLERQQVPEARAQVLLELARRLVGEDEGTVEAEAPQESAPAVVKPAAEAEPPARASRGR
ncbi:MAG TPA: exonuclease SbcCD subunit D [Chloroflexota bacterium]|nr:exonuclease SbcCD subunit D [Chloroflexota bacterium]